MHVSTGVCLDLRVVNCENGCCREDVWVPSCKTEMRVRVSHVHLSHLDNPRLPKLDVHKADFTAHNTTPQLFTASILESSRPANYTSVTNTQWPLLKSPTCDPRILRPRSSTDGVPSEKRAQNHLRQAVVPRPRLQTTIRL
jgi:hypothetical protein